MSVFTDIVLEKVIEANGLNIKTGQLASQITVHNPENTRILKISVLDANAFTAKQIADSIADISSDQIVKLMGVEQVNVIDYGNMPEGAATPKVAKNVTMGAVCGACRRIPKWNPRYMAGYRHA